jgi:hypothetical protein
MNPALPFAILFALSFSIIEAQELPRVVKDSSVCKVTMESLNGSYLGDCKMGLANGEGTARGVHRYTGKFKDGLPDGTGTYYFSDSQYYKGKFQEGKKEGKGEMHFTRSSMADSVVSGFWSGDEYRGKKYITYTFSTTEQFDITQISPSVNSGNTVSIEIATTSGTPNGVSVPGYILQLTELTSPTSCILKKQSSYETSLKSYATYELVGFPCKLFGMFSDGQTFEMELYKAANWKVRLFKNK